MIGNYIHRGIVIVIGGSESSMIDNKFTIDGVTYEYLPNKSIVKGSDGAEYNIVSGYFINKNKYYIDEVNNKVVGSNPYRVKVRVPTIDGGTTSPIRVLDDNLRWYSSMIPIDDSYVGKVVHVAYVAGNSSDGVILGGLWMPPKEGNA